MSLARSASGRGLAPSKIVEAYFKNKTPDSPQMLPDTFLTLVKGCVVSPSVQLDFATLSQACPVPVPEDKSCSWFISSPVPPTLEEQPCLPSLLQ